MKILKVIFVTALILLVSTYSHAAPAYGTKMPKKFQLFIGGQTHDVMERNLEGDNGEVKSLQHFLLLTFGLTDWLSLDLKGGAGNISQEGEFGAVDLKYQTFVGGGYGFRVKLLEKDKFKSVIGFQHISIHPYTRNTGATGETKHKSVLDDWQGSLLFSYQFKKFTPYAGAKLSRMDYIYWRNGERNRIKSDTNRCLGAVVGTDFNLNDRVWLNFEAQFIDVKAVAGSINYAF